MSTTVYGYGNDTQVNGTGTASGAGDMGTLGTGALAATLSAIFTTLLSVPAGSTIVSITPRWHVKSINFSSATSWYFVIFGTQHLNYTSAGYTPAGWQSGATLTTNPATGAAWVIADIAGLGIQWACSYASTTCDAVEWIVVYNPAAAASTYAVAILF